jgi:hypothetical protein
VSNTSRHHRLGASLRARRYTILRKWRAGD